MKALLSSAVIGLLALQMSCTTGSVSKVSSTDQLKDQLSQATASQSALPAPQVAVMPMKEGVLVAWKPISDADGYFVYRETQNPPSKKMLGIGPKEAQGFIDRDPPDGTARYSVQAFKLSDLSEKQETQALPGTTRQSDSKQGEPKEKPGMPVSYPM